MRAHYILIKYARAIFFSILSVYNDSMNHFSETFGRSGIQFPLYSAEMCDRSDAFRYRHNLNRNHISSLFV